MVTLHIYAARIQNGPTQSLHALMHIAPTFALGDIPAFKIIMIIF